MGSEREKLIVQKIYSRDPVWIQSIIFDRYIVYWNDELKWVWMDDLYDLPYILFKKNQEIEIGKNFVHFLRIKKSNLI